MIKRNFISCVFVIAAIVTSLTLPSDIAKAFDHLVVDVSIPEAAQHVSGNKKLVLDTWQAFHRGDVEAGLANMTQDVTWFAPGSGKLSGLKDGKDAVRRFRLGLRMPFAELHLNMRGLYADGDTVVMELSSRGRLSNGQPYENAGVTVWEIRDGKIAHVREYADTQKALALTAALEHRPQSGAPENSIGGAK
jgi:ketosteroid isomerase-like protein